MTDHRTLPPGDLTSVGGFLGQRFFANVHGRIKDVVMYEEFVGRYEHQRYDDWFWLGEQIGKWLDSATYAGLIAGDQALLQQVEAVLERLAAAQEKDGYLGITRKIHRTPVRGMELYEWYYVLHGLLVCADLLGSETALTIARRLGDYIIETWGTGPGQFPLAGRFPGNGHDGGEGTLILEPIVRLGQQTGDSRFLEWAEETTAMWDAWLERYPESVHTCGYTAMKQYAAGEKEIYQLRDNIHAHTFHMTLLGVAALYDATGKQEYRDTVTGCVDRIIEDWIFITGGMSSGERYVPHRFYHTVGDIEVCPQHTWILLLEQLYQWTGKALYIAEIERVVFNQLLAAQLADGSNWSYMTPLNGRAQEPASPNCCNASGQRILARIPCYAYGLRDNHPAVLMYTASSATINAPGLPAIGLQQTTDFPAQGAVRIAVQIESPTRFPLHLRIPQYATGATVRVNSEAASTALAGSFTVIEREWRAGDVVELSLPLPLTCQASAREVAIIRGPLVYAYFQNAQASSERYRWHQARYPFEMTLALDPTAPGGSLAEEAAGDGLLGPVLRVRGNMLPRAPMFASEKTNAELPAARSEDVLLLPFVNQGSVRGQYQVFMQYDSSG